ncbi:GFA family protein [Palleronia caenipelagi]|uniref:GFA family protein n=1 Tax=Palleronia caenipelagi TaxID=2489174 RepID=A0A547Q6S0_9RHOB|nr:GFA family protein [Palleronia caenipelagi]TRD22079.1 GFA family protein [Palleronia caenipelagi]
MRETACQTGGCLCGAVRYRLTEAPEGYGACHCGMCRRWSGGALLAVQVSPGGVAWQGEGAIRTYASSDWAERGWCRECGSNLFWRLTAPGPMQGMVALSAGSLDSLDGLELTSEIYIDHKPAGYAFAGERQRMTEAEVLAAFGPGN